MKVRLLFAWQQWSKGHVFTAMPATQAEVMVRAGQAEYVDRQAPSPLNRMLSSARKLAGRGAKKASPAA